MPDIVDHMIRVPDQLSIAGALYCERLLGRRVGPSTGTNLIGAIELAAGMKVAGESGPVVTLICDSGLRYGETVYDQNWRRSQRLESGAAINAIDHFFKSGHWDPSAAMIENR